MRDARQLLVKNGAHIGTQRKLDQVRKFIFKIRDDGLAVLDVQQTIERLKAAAKVIARYKLEDVLVVASRQQAATPAKKFAEITGLNSFTGRFMPGTMTNPNLDYFTEPKLLVASDTYGDSQAIMEAFHQGIPAISMVSTNNVLSRVDLAIPCNNKGRRSLAAAYWLLTNYVLFERGELKSGEEIAQGLEDFLAPRVDRQE